MAKDTVIRIYLRAGAFSEGTGPAPGHYLPGGAPLPITVGHSALNTQQGALDLFKSIEVAIRTGDLVLNPPGGLPAPGQPAPGIQSPLGAKGEIWIHNGTDDAALPPPNDEAILVGNPSNANGMQWKNKINLGRSTP